MGKRLDIFQKEVYPMANKYKVFNLISHQDNANSDLLKYNSIVEDETRKGLITPMS